MPERILTNVAGLPLDLQREMLAVMEAMERKEAPLLAARRPAPQLLGPLRVRGDIVAPAFDEADWVALR